MSFAQYQQYYLQTMGVDVYLSRQQTQSVEPNDNTDAVAPVPSNPEKPKLKPQADAIQAKPAKESQPPAKAPSAPAFIVSKQTMMQNELVADVGRVFAFDIAQIEQLGDNTFKMANLTWQLDGQDRAPALQNGVLTSGPLDALQNTAAKRQLWRCLTQLMENSAS